jgi:hypothetical protein
VRSSQELFLTKFSQGMASISYVGVLAKSMDERSRARRNGMSRRCGFRAFLALSIITVSRRRRPIFKNPNEQKLSRSWGSPGQINCFKGSLSLEPVPVHTVLDGHRLSEVGVWVKDLKEPPSRDTLSGKWKFGDGMSSNSRCVTLPGFSADLD